MYNILSFSLKAIVGATPTPPVGLKEQGAVAS